MNSSLIETYTLTPWAQEKGLARCFVYRGPSMTPTFFNGDFLYVRTNMQNLRLGDVVVFSTQNTADGYIVHRIIANSHQGFITRGDHNRLNDALPLTLKEIVGKVEFVENRRGIRKVSNGPLGLWLAGILWLMFGLDRLIRLVFWMPYNLIRERRIATTVWHPKISKMQVRSENGQQIKYLYKNSTVAVWDLSRQRFECRKPFDLVIPNPKDSE
jgi:signal peptidase I